MADKNYSAFFYGTLMARQVLNRVIYNQSVMSKYHSDNIKTHPAILHDHRRHRVLGADYPAVIPVPGSSVRGTYVTGLTDANMVKLDLFEGSEYERCVVKPRLLEAVGDSATGKGNVEGDQVEAETYIWIGGKEYLEDEEWDFAHFEKEKMRFWVSGDAYGEFKELENAYQAHQEAQQQDGTGGRGANGHITKALESNHANATAGAQDKDTVKSAV